jgi:hypothetical protein
MPSEPAQVAPYLKQPLEAALVQKYLRKLRADTAVPGRQGNGRTARRSSPALQRSRAFSGMSTPVSSFSNVALDWTAVPLLAITNHTTSEKPWLSLAGREAKASLVPRAEPMDHQSRVASDVVLPSGS